MICMMFNVKLFLLFILISLYVFDKSINVSRSHPTPTPNPGHQHSNHFDRVSPYLSSCNWNLNTSSKDEFPGVSLLNAHNSIHNYVIISLCETSLSNSDFVPDNILQGYNYHACNHTSDEKKGVLVFFIRTHYQL